MLVWKKLVGTALLFLLVALVAFGFAPASAQAPGATTTTTATVSANTVVTATATLTPTATSVPATATHTSVPPSATATVVPATATKTAVPPSATLAPATATQTRVLPTTTVTKTLAPSATATKPAATATATKSATATKVPPTATSVPKAVAPRAGVVTSLSTMFAVQNTDPSTTANVTATFYDPSGAAVSTVNRTILPYRSTVVDQRAADGGLGSFSSWQGSVVLSSNTQLAAVVVQYGGTAGSGTDFRMDSYPGTSSSAASTSILLPQLIKNIYSPLYQRTYNSTYAIQNTSSSVAANVTITYTNPGASPPTYVRSGIQIPPGASAIIDMANETLPWSEFNGPARVSSDQDVTVVVNANTVGVLGAYVGYTSADASTVLVVPQAVTNIGTMLWGSAIAGMTVDGSSSNYTVTYSNSNNGAQRTCNLPSGSNFMIDFRPQYWFPGACTPPLDSSNQFFGNVVITGTKPLVASVNTQAVNIANGVRVTIGNAFPSTGGTTTGFAPLMMNAYLDSGTQLTYGTAIAGRMEGTGTVQITYYQSTGQVYTDTTIVESDRMFVFDQRFTNPRTGFSLPPGFIGSAKIVAPHPFVFRVNINGDLARFGDVVGTYRGINQ